MQAVGIVGQSIGYSRSSIETCKGSAKLGADDMNGSALCAVPQSGGNGRESTKERPRQIVALWSISPIMDSKGKSKQAGDVRIR